MKCSNILYFLVILTVKIKLSREFSITCRGVASITEIKSRNSAATLHIQLPMFDIDEESEELNDPAPLICGVHHENCPMHARFTRYLYKLLPIETQFGMRDSGFLRKCLDASVTASIGIIGISNPGLTWRFFKLQRRMVKYKYGQHVSQFIDWFPVEKKPNEGTRVFAFVHGGAWGSGKPWMYRLIAERLNSLGYSVAIMGYRTYPDGDADSQIEDLANGIEYLRTSGLVVQEEDKPVTLLLGGHSSGAHISAMYLLRRCQNVNQYCEHPKIHGFVGISGVYDIHKHYIYETWRGVHLISPMRAANGGAVEHFLHYSPSIIVAEQLSQKAAVSFPPTLLFHGTDDHTVPFTSSEQFRISLMNKGIKVDMKYLDGADHFFPVGELMFEQNSEVEKCVEQLFKEVETNFDSLLQNLTQSMISKL